MSKSSQIPRFAGLTLAGVGLAHFVKPELFHAITVTSFPNNTRTFTYVNGGLETALGVGLAVPQTRKLTAVAGIGYLAYLAANTIRNR